MQLKKEESSSSPQKDILCNIFFNGLVQRNFLCCCICTECPGVKGVEAPCIVCIVFASLNGPGVVAEVDTICRCECEPLVGVDGALGVRARTDDGSVILPVRSNGGLLPSRE